MKRILISAATVIMMAAAPVAVVASPAEATCLTPKVTVTHGSTYVQAQIFQGCNIEAYGLSNYFGYKFGAEKSGASYSVAYVTSGGWQFGGWRQNVNGSWVYHKTF